LNGSYRGLSLHHGYPVWRLLCCLLLLVLPGVLQAAVTPQDAQINLQAGRNEYVLSLHLQYLEDADHTLDLDGARQALQAGRFQGGQTQALNLGFTESAYWFYLRIHNRNSTRNQWVLESLYSIMDQLDVYYRFNDGREQHQQAGDSVMFHQRARAHHNINFGLELAAGETVDVFIRAQTTGAIQMPVMLWSEVAFADKVSTEQIVFGLYYGMLFSLGIYNLLLFLVIRDRNYLLYVFYIASYGLFQMSLNGLAFQYLWPDSPDWNNRSIACLMGIGMFFITLFSHSFLALKNNSPFLSKVFIGFMVVYLGIAAATFVLPYQLVIRTGTLASTFGVLCIMTSAVVCLIKRFRPARYFFVSWAVLLLGMLAYTLKTFSLLPANFITEYAIQIGSVLEVLLLSLALADRIRILQDENQRMQARVNEELEQHVRERTLELERANRKLEELSTTDGLTGLKNRRHFNEVFALECKRTSRSGDTLSVILIDIDHFKNLNDSYGHLLGDECIKAVADAIAKAAFRQTDTKCRYGGEEFVVLMPSTPAEGALRVAGNIQEAIRALEIPHQGKKLAVTASLGVATVASEHEDAVRDVLAQADQALYQAKASGRNAVVSFSRGFTSGQVKKA
jgi:diguanylate cyclase